MPTVEVVQEHYCPVIDGNVEIRILYEVTGTAVCQINIEPLIIECNRCSQCDAFEAGEEKCLLFNLLTNEW